MLRHTDSGLDPDLLIVISILFGTTTMLILALAAKWLRQTQLRKR